MAATAWERWERWAPVSGIVGIVLLAVGTGLTADAPAPDESSHKIVSWVTGSSNQTRQFIGVALVGLAGVALLWFVGTLRARLARAEGDPARLAGIAFGGGLTFVMLLFVATATTVVIPATASFTNKFHVDADTTRVFLALGYWLVGAAALGGAVLVGATSLVVLRTRLFGAWFGYVGVAVAVLLLLFIPLFGFPGVLFGLWIVTTSAMLLRQPPVGMPTRA